MLTTSFTLTVAANAGYGHDNVATGDVIASHWQQIAAKVHAELGVYVSATITPARVIYHTDWGCPVGGEHVATCTGVRNPEFTPDDVAYRAAVREISKRLALALGQKRVYLQWHQATLEVIENEHLPPIR